MDREVGKSSGGGVKKAIYVSNWRAAAPVEFNEAHLANQTKVKVLAIIHYPNPVRPLCIIMIIPPDSFFVLLVAPRRQSGA